MKIGKHCNICDFSCTSMYKVYLVNTVLLMLVHYVLISVHCQWCPCTNECATKCVFVCVSVCVRMCEWLSENLLKAQRRGKKRKWSGNWNVCAKRILLSKFLKGFLCWCLLCIVCTHVRKYVHTYIHMYMHTSICMYVHPYTVGHARFVCRQAWACLT